MAQITYLDKIRIQELIDEIKRRLSTQSGNAFVGTEEEWDALPSEQQQQYSVAYITNDYHIDNSLNYIVSPDRPGGEYTEGNFWFVTNDETVTEFAGLTVAKVEKIYRYLTDEETHILSWKLITPTKSETEPIAYEGKLWIKINEETGFFEGIYICTEVSPDVVWAEIYPTADEGQTLAGVYVNTQTPASLGNYWFDIDSEENRALEGLYQYSLVEGAEVWDLVYKIEAFGGVGEDLGNGNERFNAYDDRGNHNTIDGGSYNHAEGCCNTLANGCYATHIEGTGNSASYTNRSFISGNHNTVTNGYCHIVSGEGNTVTNGGISVISGQNNTVTNSYDSAVSGQGNQVTGTDDIVSGMNNIVTASEVIVNGNGNTVNGATNSITTGDSNSNSGNMSITVGSQNTNSGANAVVGGNMNSNSGGRTGVFGDNNSNNYADDAVVCGSQNINSKSRAIMCGHGGQNSSHYFAIGNGSASSRNLAFYVDPDGTVYAEGQYNSPGADYAEYFEWADGNPGNEDRRGMLVRLEGDKIVPADGDEILGAVSSRPSVVGNSCEEHWRGKYKTDIFGDYILDENGERQLSGEYDTDMEYIPRSQRPEWAAVGMVGRLIVCDNGKCTVGQYITAQKGVAVPATSKTDVQMLRRADTKHIEVLVK